MYANDRGGGLAARASQQSDRPKYPSPPQHRFRRLDWARYRRFLRHGWKPLLALLRRLVRDLPTPYSVRPPGTRGRPPTDPRDVVRFLLLRTLEGWSYDEVHATLDACPEFRRRLGFRHLPAAPTVAALSARVPPTYLERLVAELARRCATRPLHLAGDGTGLSTRRFERWIAARAHSGHRHAFVKLHALVSTRAQFPLFYAAHVTDAYTNDVTELRALLAQVPPDLPLGNVALDRGYLGKRNAQTIADRGGRPVIALRHTIPITTTPDGCPAWKAMVVDQLTHRREFRCRYRRRAVIEGVFGAFKERFGASIRSHRTATQTVEILTRVVVWNALALTYHRS
ncbi:MAG: transposase [Thermoplasmata archaeon]